MGATHILWLQPPLHYPFNKMFDGPHSWPGCFGKQNSAVQWHRLLVTSLVPWRPGFSPSPVTVGSAMDVVGKQNNALQRHRLLVSSLLPQRPGFSPSPVTVGSAMDVVALGQASLHALQFPHVTIIPPILHTHLHLSPTPCKLRI